MTMVDILILIYLGVEVLVPMPDLKNRGARIPTIDTRPDMKNPLD